MSMYARESCGAHGNGSIPGDDVRLVEEIREVLGCTPTTSFNNQQLLVPPDTTIISVEAESSMFLFCSNRQLEKCL
ncbi:hypothetical protein ACHAWU_004090 [Discostella pseudostelligera]|uniref:Uncharacterized protein n=1 Tax=Discostella pseudostelligera TaxID=259834 RepID=A0ABD3MKK2_9STRA